MQREREGRENSRTAGRQMDNFGSFGFQGSMFGGKDPFDDPFFSRPHGSFFGLDKSNVSKPVIEELDSDAEGAQDEESDVGSVAWTNRNPLVEHPEDQGNDHASKIEGDGDVSSTSNQIKVEAKKPQSGSVSFQRVTYGGIDGAYYTATSSRRTGDDGVTLDERKQADRTTGEAAHRVSRGIHGKGLSVTRKLDSDGKVETVQTLQNLNEDELEGFEQAWGGIGGHDTFNFPRILGSGSRLGPLAANGSRSLNRNQQSTSGRPKKVVTINIE